jgi:hypothetical protein
MKDVVQAIETAGLFDGIDVGRFFDDADRVLIAGGVGAVGAGVDVGDVVADGAEAEVLLEGGDGGGEVLGVGVEARRMWKA